MVEPHPTSCLSASLLYKAAALQQPVQVNGLVVMVLLVLERRLGRKAVVVMNNGSCVLEDLYVQILVHTRRDPARLLEGPPENLPITQRREQNSLFFVPK